MSNKSPYKQEKSEKSKGEILRQSGQNFFAYSDKKYNQQINKYYDSNTNSKNLKNSNNSKDLNSTIINLFGSQKSNNSLYPNYNEDEKYEINHEISGVKNEVPKEIENIKTKDVLENISAKNDIELHLFNNKNLEKVKSSLQGNSIDFNQINMYPNSPNQNNQNINNNIYNQNNINGYNINQQNFMNNWNIRNNANQNMGNAEDDKKINNYLNKFILL